MAKIINLVHELVLRRDRESEQRESLASHVRNMRVEEAQRHLEIEKMHNRNEELARSMSTLEAQERAWKANIRKAEAQAKDLKEQMLKMKSTLDQVRAKCIGDVRKRDIELEKLKTHLTGLQRGKRDASGMKINIMNPQPAMLGAKEMRGGVTVNSAEWSLEKETNDFLAALVNETSTENVTLRALVGDTLEELKMLTGLDQEQEQAQLSANDEDGIGIPGQYRQCRKKAQETQLEPALVPCEKLATEMSTVMEHCKAILKDPSFVSIEEVQIREEEIVKLREGWEKMANKWKEAVLMMDMWRRRMMDGGDSIDLAELSNLEFAKSMAVLPNGEAVLSKEEDLSTAMFDEENGQEGDNDKDGEQDPERDQCMNGSNKESNTGRGFTPEKKIFNHDPADILLQNESDEESELDIPPEPSPKRLATSPARRGMRLPRPNAALSETSGNAQLYSRDYNISNTESADSGIGSPDGSVGDPIKQQESRGSPVKRPSRIPQVSVIASQSYPDILTSSQAKKENIPPMTIEEKLALVEAEAKEAEARREAAEAKAQTQNPNKRKASRPLMGRKASRRRSTLAPDELAQLMGVRTVM